jgi:hypothetical protein
MTGSSSAARSVEVRREAGIGNRRVGKKDHIVAVASAGRQAKLLELTVASMAQSDTKSNALFTKKVNSWHD